MTDMPTARPASEAFIQAWRIESVTRAATAIKIMAMAMFQGPTPQVALDQQCMFKPAANPPTTQTIGENFHCRNMTKALNPSNNIVSGAKIFRYISGEMTVASRVATVGDELGSLKPIQLPSTQWPV